MKGAKSLQAEESSQKKWSTYCANSPICEHFYECSPFNPLSAHFEQLVGSVGGADAQLLQQLHHEAAEALECARQPYLRVDLYEHIFCRVHVQRLQTVQHAVCQQINNRDAVSMPPLKWQWQQPSILKHVSPNIMLQIDQAWEFLQL